MELTFELHSTGLEQARDDRDRITLASAELADRCDKLQDRQQALGKGRTFELQVASVA